MASGHEAEPAARTALRGDPDSGTVMCWNELLMLPYRPRTDCLASCATSEVRHRCQPLYRTATSKARDWGILPKQNLELEREPFMPSRCDYLP